MEYLSGGSLRGLLSQRGRLPVDDAVRIAADVCDGLAAAHAKGIVHRDIKPENILLAADGRAKVGDFGIAHVPRTAGGAYPGGLTQTGFQPGTLVYMSPEQIRGEAVDGRSDVYQVGALLYEMLAGRHYIDVEALTRRAKETAGSNVALFQAKWYGLLAEAVCDRPQEGTGGLQGLRSDTPEWVQLAVGAALIPQAMRRPTGGELAQALRQKNVLAVTASEIVTAQNQKEAKEHLERARDMEPKAAIAELELAVRAWPGYAEAYCKLGEAHTKEAYCKQGEAHTKMKSLAEAITAYERAVLLDPSLVVAHIELAKLYKDQGSLEQADRSLREAIRRDPDMVFSSFRHDISFLLAVSAFAPGGGSGAMADYLRIVIAFQEVTAQNPTSPNLHYNLGRVLAFDEHSRKEAIMEFHHALRLKPDYPEAQTAMAELYLKMNSPEQALPFFQRAASMGLPLQRKPFSELHHEAILCRTDALLGVARSQFRLGKVQEARTTIKAAIDVALPDDTETIWAEVARA